MSIVSYAICSNVKTHKQNFVATVTTPKRTISALAATKSHAKAIALQNLRVLSYF